MMANNKVLTVSYGTFSCTLEGFDDSFETMKLIAEYFRDLAAEDRYFGAEPPAPDAEMLAQIAKRDMARHIEARNEDGQIHLSAQSAATGVAATAATTAAVLGDAAIEEGAFEFVADAEDGLAEEAQVEAGAVDTAPDVAAAASVPTVAERLMRIRSVVTDEAAPAPAATDDEYSEDEHAQDGAGTGFASISEAFADIEDEDIAAVAPAELEVEEAAAEAPAPLPEFEEEAEADAPEAEEAETFDAETLAHTPFVFEDSEEQDDLSAMLERIESEETEVASAEATIAPESGPEPVDDETQSLIAGFLDQTNSDFAAEDDAIAEGVADAAIDEPVTEEAAEEILDVAAFEEELEDEFEDEALAGAPTEEDKLPPEPLEIEDVTPESAPAPAGEVQPRRARVLKIKRTDLSKAFEAGKIEDVETPETDADAPAQMMAMSSLSAEEEAELTAELASLQETELDGTAVGQTEADETEVDETKVDETADPVTGQFGDDTVVLKDLPPIEELMAQAEAADAAVETDAASDEPEVEFSTDVDRLMDKADAEMDEPETTKRRNAFQALKAAVAARKADIGLGGGREAEREASQKSEEYRSDLAQVVKSDRKEAEPEAAAEDARTRPAPLRLVAEQRVDSLDADAQDEADAALAAGGLQADETDESVDDEAQFTAYVEALGAHELPDLLEAAASYLAHVEGKEQFSRPQLMAKVRLIAGADYSREAGLRSFGQLLRAGKIEKIRGGRFTVTPETGFRPDARVAG